MCLTCWSESAPSYSWGLVVCVFRRVPSHVGYIWTWPAFFATRLSDAVSRFHSSAAQSSPSAAAGRLCVTSLRWLHSVSCEQSKGQLFVVVPQCQRRWHTRLTRDVLQPIQWLSEGWLVSQGLVLLFHCSFCDLYWWEDKIQSPVWERGTCAVVCTFKGLIFRALFVIVDPTDLNKCPFRAPENSVFSPLVATTLQNEDPSTFHNVVWEGGFWLGGLFCPMWHHKGQIDRTVFCSAYSERRSK